MVMDFELGDWLMRILSLGHRANNHSHHKTNLIEINFSSIDFRQHETREMHAPSFDARLQRLDDRD
jgi:hypothetical protein